MSDDGKKSPWQITKLLRSSEKGRVGHRMPPEGKKKKDFISTFSSVTQHWNDVLCESLFTQFQGIILTSKRDITVNVKTLWSFDDIKPHREHDAHQ